MGKLSRNLHWIGHLYINSWTLCDTGPAVFLEATSLSPWDSGKVCVTKHPQTPLWEYPGYVVVTSWTIMTSRTCVKFIYLREYQALSCLTQTFFSWEYWSKSLPIVGVHDSFWTHACDVNQMNRILREKFVELYSMPILEDVSMLKVKVSFLDEHVSRCPRYLLLFLFLKLLLWYTWYLVCSCLKASRNHIQLWHFPLYLKEVILIYGRFSSLPTSLTKIR